MENLELLRVSSLFVRAFCWLAKARAVVGQVRGLNPVLVEINRAGALGISASGTRHGAARQQLNRWKIPCLAFREPIGDTVQLVSRMPCLQPQSSNACCNEATIRCPSLKLEQPALIKLIVQQQSLRKLSFNFWKLRSFLEGGGAPVRTRFFRLAQVRPFRLMARVSCGCSP